MSVFRITTMKVALAAAAVAAAIGSAPAAQARQGFAAIAVDARTGKVIFARNADARRIPASITKVMTIYLLFGEIRRGRYTLSSRLRISRHAASMPPTKLGLRPGSTITVDNAIRALVTKSANDIAAAIGENIAGSERAFAYRMTMTARRIGMTRTTFRNASGLPKPPNVSTARDLATLALRIQRDYPRLYKKYFSIRYFRYGRRVFRNHNRLLGRVRGMDGLKTGYTRAAGYNLAASTMRNGKRIVTVVLGASSGRSRNRYMAALIEKMFRTRPLRKGVMIASMAGRPPGWNPAMARRVNFVAAKPARKPAVTPRIRPKSRPKATTPPARLALAMPQARPAKIRPATPPAKPVKMAQRPAGRTAPAPAPETTTVAAPRPLRVEGKVFASVRPQPAPVNDAAGQQEAAMKTTPTRVASIADVISLPATTSQPAPADNETLIIKGDAPLAVEPVRQPGERQVASTGSREDSPLPDEAAEATAVKAHHDADDAVKAAADTESRRNTTPAASGNKGEENMSPAMKRRLATWNIQLGSFPAPEGARSRISEARRRSNPLLRGKEGFTMVFRKGSATYYRARFAGFNRKTARRACRLLKRKGISCFVLAPKNS